MKILPRQSLKTELFPSKSFVEALRDRFCLAIAMRDEP